MSEEQRCCNDGRRRLCKFCIGSMTVASGAMVGYPVIAFLGQPIRVSSGKPVEVPLDQLASGQAQYAEFQGQQIIVLSTPQGPRVFSASCPHLGCNVIWETVDQVFRCPCHGAVFSSEGEVVSGPVASPLKTVPFEIKEGKLIVT